MGYSQSKPEQQNNVAIAQTVSNETIGQHISYLEILLTGCAVVLGVVLLCYFRNGCKRSVRNWFRKEAAMVGLSPPVVKVHTVQQSTGTQGQDVY